MSFNIEPVQHKPSRRFTTAKVKDRRLMYESNVSEDGFFTKALVRVMSPRLEQYFRTGKVAYIELTNNTVHLVLSDSSKVLVK